MAKPMSKKLEKRARRAVKETKKSVKNLKPNGAPSRGTVAGVAAGVAGVAGLAAAIRYLRRNSEGRARLHVRADGDQWVVTEEGADKPLNTFQTKDEALEAAREIATKAAPSELVIHRLDGSVMRSHTYAAV